MLTGSSLVLGLFAASAWAAPGACKQKKAVCNADNCLRAVRASSAKPFPSVASADCASFMSKTVTPCASTTTTTTIVTVTAAPVGVTVTNVQPQTQINTIVQTITSVVATVEDTVTLIQPSPVEVTNFIVSAVTVTAGGPNKKRAANNLAALPTFPAPLDHVEARAITSGAASTCPATTRAPSAVPTYASACSGTARYSSACSCAGYTGVTTTAPRPTVTATATSTSTVTPTNTAQITVTTTVPVTVVGTQVIPTTFETTDATVVVPSPYTVTTNVVIPTTVVVSPPVCSSYKFVITSGAGLTGSYITGDSPDNSVPYGFVLNNGDAGSAISFSIRPDGLVYSNNVDRWMTRAGQLYYVLHAEDSYADSYGIDGVYCSVGNGDSSYPNAAGTLSCSSGGHAINFYTCPSTGSDLVQGTDANSANYGCTQFSVAAIRAC